MSFNIGNMWSQKKNNSNTHKISNINTLFTSLVIFILFLNYQTLSSWMYKNSNWKLAMILSQDHAFHIQYNFLKPLCRISNNRSHWYVNSGSRSGKYCVFPQILGKFSPRIFMRKIFPQTLFGHSRRRKLFL